MSITLDQIIKQLEDTKSTVERDLEKAYSLRDKYNEEDKDYKFGSSPSSTIKLNGLESSTEGRPRSAGVTLAVKDYLQTITNRKRFTVNDVAWSLGEPYTKKHISAVLQTLFSRGVIKVVAKEKLIGRGAAVNVYQKVGKDS